MTRRTIYDKYLEATEALTDNVRKLDFAGIAVVWLIIVGDTGGVVSSSNELNWPLLLFVLSLTSDLLQFVYRAIVFGLLNTHLMGKGKSLEDDIEYSGKWNYPTLLLFWAKIALCGIGYVLLASTVGDQLWRN